jgi:hypothetical protein
MPPHRALLKGHKRSQVILQVATTVASAVLVYAQQRLIPELYHTSILTGRVWVQELLDGHERQIQDILGMHKHMFIMLVSELQQKSGLRNLKYVNSVEMIAIFLYAVIHNSTN